jgi:hypothetical protein
MKKSTVKKSEIIRKEIEAAEAEYKARIKADVFDRSDRTAENHDELWDTFWDVYGREQHHKIEDLKWQLSKERNREIEVGDGVTLHLWSDSHACTVIARTATTLTIQRDKATLDPNFKPEWIPGGFAGHCTNQDEQTYTYEADPNGEIYKCRWSEKYGRFQSGSDGSMKITLGRREFYDYNF